MFRVGLTLWNAVLVAGDLVFAECVGRPAWGALASDDPYNANSISLGTLCCFDTSEWPASHALDHNGVPTVEVRL